MKVSLQLRLLVLLTGVLCACSVDRRELDRHGSPDEKLMAVLVEATTGGAAGAVSYDLYVYEVRASHDLDKPVFTASHCEGLTFSWLNDYTLQLHYQTPCSIEHFTNRWYRPTDVAVGRDVPIEITLVRG
jgi:hypothetical protein